MASHPNLLGAEPKDGDFVAYVAEIERRQMAAMHAPRVAPPAPAQPPSLGPAPHAPSAHGPSPRDVAASAGERPPLNKAQAAAIMDVLTSQSSARTAVTSQDFIGSLIIAFVALVFFLAGASGGHVVPMLIGGGLGWLAFTRLRRVVRGGSGDLAERLKRGGFKT
jgi:hypothetical protein